MIYLRLFLEFFKVGLFTFGGGYAMIPLIKEMVLKYGWLTETQFYDFIGVCETTPGPIAVNMATYIGSVNGGFLGSLVATIGVVLPSFIIILMIVIRMDGRGLHDLASQTKVISLDKNGVEIEENINLDDKENTSNKKISSLGKKRKRSNN